MAEDTTIAILPADRDDRRLRLVLLAGRGEEARLRLCDETYSDDVGWFAQGQIELSPSQIGDLRAALGAPDSFGGKRAARPRPRFDSTAAERGEAVVLSLVRAG